MTGRRQTLIPKPAPGEWAQRANCMGLDASLFFPEKSDSAAVQHAAKAVCEACEVRWDCLEYALTPPIDRVGIWGGFGIVERDRILRRRRMGLA